MNKKREKILGLYPARICFIMITGVVLLLTVQTLYLQAIYGPVAWWYLRDDDNPLGLWLDQRMF